MFLFIGEKPSERAHSQGYTWESGKLAAKTLFDALDECDIDKNSCSFINLFGVTPNYKEGNTLYAKSQINKIKRDYNNYKLVALGEKVSKVLNKHDISHLKIVHPAARGKIRKKELYNAHVASILKNA